MKPKALDCSESFRSFHMLDEISAMFRERPEAATANAAEKLWFPQQSKAPLTRDVILDTITLPASAPRQPPRASRIPSLEGC